MSTVLTPDQILRLGLIVSPIVLFLAVLYSRAGTRRMIGAMAGGVAYAAVAYAWDTAALGLGWWGSPGIGGQAPPAIFYLPVAVAYGAPGALLGWRAARKWGRRGMGAFLSGWALFGIGHDRVVASLAATSRVLAFAPGIVPLLGDALRWASAAAVAQGVMWLVAGPPETDLLAGQPASA
ncbi:MAG: hypothetical protein C4521_08140 [Actinobacteria bacterium]|nr:MAG: hypothetical protein C4521_08140 [Actinomycetota bacterium]